MPITGHMAGITIDRGQLGEAAEGSEIISLYNSPFPGLSLLSLVQRSFPLFAGVALSPLLRKDSVSNFEIAMRCASVPSCVPGSIKLFHCGFADRAKEGPRQRSIPNSQTD
jgi:hypothetical protein